MLQIGQSIVFEIYILSNKDQMSRIQILFLFFCCSASAQTIEPIAFDGNVTQEEWANGLHLKRCSTVL